MSNIAIFGDSIVHGVFDLEKGGWAERLKVDYWNSQPESQSEVYVFGIDGSTTKDLLNRFDVEISSMLYGVDIAILAIGINDTAIYKSGAMETELTFFKENIEALIRKAQKKVDHVYLCGLMKVTEKLVNPLPVSKSGKSYKNRHIKEYDNILLSVAEEKEVSFIPLYELLNEEDLFDGIHPNSQGHEKIFDCVRLRLVEDNLI